MLPALRPDPVLAVHLGTLSMGADLAYQNLADLQMRLYPSTQHDVSYTSGLHKAVTSAWRFKSDLRYAYEAYLKAWQACDA